MAAGVGLVALALLWAVWPRPHLVLDCQGGVGHCVVHELDAVLVSCQPWRPDTCLETKVGVRQVSYVADPVNQVTSPFPRESFTVEVLPQPLSQPWDLEFLPDGRMLVTEKKGRIVLLNDGIRHEVGRVRVLDVGETGLLGLAIDPDFAATGRIFVYYTVGWDPLDLSPPGHPKRRLLNRISSFHLRDGSLVGEQVLLDDIPGAVHHSGGRLEIGPDGKLYATTGDASVPDRAQDVAFLGGKVLRLNLDGSVPSDNPFPESPVFSRGHRNPQGLAWAPSGDLLECEHGPWRFDEINRIRAGANYGWGSFSCTERVFGGPEAGLATFPVVCFETWTAAPSGMTFVLDEESPWYGSLFVAMLRGRHVHRFRFEGDTVALDEIFFVSAGPDGTADRNLDLRIRDVEYRDGSLYVLGDAFGLAMLTPR